MLVLIEVFYTPDRMLEQVMVLEYKYGAQGISVREYILDYLDEVRHYPRVVKYC